MKQAFLSFEKLRGAIFFLTKAGRVVHMNEAARKLLRVTRLSVSEAERALTGIFLREDAPGYSDPVHIQTSTLSLNLVSSAFEDPECFLVKVSRPKSRVT